KRILVDRKRKIGLSTFLAMFFLLFLFLVPSFLASSFAQVPSNGITRKITASLAGYEIRAGTKGAVSHIEGTFLAPPVTGCTRKSFPLATYYLFIEGGGFGDGIGLQFGCASNNTAFFKPVY